MSAFATATRNREYKKKVETLRAMLAEAASAQAAGDDHLWSLLQACVVAMGNTVAKDYGRRFTEVMDDVNAGC